MLKSSSTRYRNTLITVIKLNICLTDNHIQGEGGGAVTRHFLKCPSTPPPPNTYTRMHSWTHTFRFLLQMWGAKAQISLRIRTVSQKHSMLAYTKYGWRSTLRPSIRQLSLLDTSAWLLRKHMQSISKYCGLAHILFGMGWAVFEFVRIWMFFDGGMQWFGGDLGVYPVNI